MHNQRFSDASRRRSLPISNPKVSSRFSSPLFRSFVVTCFDSDFLFRSVVFVSRID